MEKKFGPMMQMAFVVNDFDEPINFWTKKMNIGPFFKLENLNVKEVYYMDKPTELDFSVAIAYTGNMQIELVNQHCDTPSIYNEYVNNEKGSLHHLCTLTNDIENDISILESQGYINLQGGKTQDDGKDQKPPRQSYGHSIAIDPWGNIIGHIDSQTDEGYFVAEVDQVKIEEIRRNMPCQE